MITRFKAGCTIEPTAVTARLLGAVDRVAMNSSFDITVTSGSDSHPLNDVHTRGLALDLRSHDLDDVEKADMMRAILWELADEAPEDVSARNHAWLALETDEWFIQLEHHGDLTEHVHLQRRQGALPFD
jgi:hypothetical protein